MNVSRQQTCLFWGGRADGGCESLFPDRVMINFRHEGVMYKEIGGMQSIGETEIIIINVEISNIWMHVNWLERHVQIPDD